jgi:hypothetical protein
LINQEQLFWKQQVPANDKKKPLTNEVGYKAMIAKLKELTKKGKDTVITLSLPPLSKVATMVSFNLFFQQTSYTFNVS